MRIIEVGSLNMDLVVRMPQIPKPGETLLGGTFATFPGGKGANQAVAAARLGAQVSMIGRVGNDAFGRELLDVLQKDGIDTRFVSVDASHATGVALIEVDAQGMNSIAVASGANFALTAKHVADAISQTENFDVLVMPLETPLDTIYAAARAAKQKNARVILNPAPAQKLGADLLGMVDVIVPNEHEATFITGIALEGEQSYRAAAQALRQMGAKSVILTLGSAGAFVLDGTREELVPAQKVQAVDTTAAGDCFTGGLAVGLAEGKSLGDAARFASAAAAISVTRHGAQPSMPYRSEVTGS
ncbi:MAG TPA: ribokinase [Thermoflexales bacterium]|nr:ribokinase [Thermoflexales bacterium]HQW34979.1 ribokinase [Thermoflexales bacterium]